MTPLSSTKKHATEATVIGINGNIVRIETAGGAIMKNEVAYVCVGDERLKIDQPCSRQGGAVLVQNSLTPDERFGIHIETEIQEKREVIGRERLIETDHAAGQPVGEMPPRALTVVDS